LTPIQERHQLVELIEEAVRSGARKSRACSEASLSVRTLPPCVRVVVAFLLIYQAAFKILFGSFILGLFGLRCTSVIGSQFRVLPDQRVGLA